MSYVILTPVSKIWFNNHNPNGIKLIIIILIIIIIIIIIIMIMN